ncbi:MAG: transposase [Chitinophagaceae bacterium]|nr:transposase [Chitinophagaceae bacterium]MCA6460387.1 transposase [Chitinophagaceae bacterium]MCA6465274.1 transposase [Chitinophagaceae bacterium]
MILGHAQHGKYAKWIEEYNHKRPHESLENMTPFKWKTNLINKWKTNLINKWKTNLIKND